MMGEYKIKNMPDAELFLVETDLRLIRLNIDCGLFLFYTSSKLRLTAWLDMDRRWDYGIQNNR